MEKRVILTRGIQGSGKSTWAKAWVLENPKERIRICYDDLRMMMGGGPEGYRVPGKRDTLLQKVRDTLLIEAMEKGFEVVIDNLNLYPKELSGIKDIVESCPGNYEVITRDFFDVPLEECIRRDSLREHPIGRQVITAYWNRYRDLLEGGRE